MINQLLTKEHEIDNRLFVEILQKASSCLDEQEGLTSFTKLLAPKQAIRHAGIFSCRIFGP